MAFIDSPDIDLQDMIFFQKMYWKRRGVGEEWKTAKCLTLIWSSTKMFNFDYITKEDRKEHNPK